MRNPRSPSLALSARTLRLTPWFNEMITNGFLVARLAHPMLLVKKGP
jgi:hypothetical protein